ncbi:MAG: outer membrane protein assembly factor BamA [Pikeienuella sp.]
MKMPIYRHVGAAMRAALVATAFAALAPMNAGAQLAQQQTASGQTLIEVVVIGNRRIEAETIRSYLAIRPGDPITEGALNRSVRQLFDTGLFRDAAIAPDGGRLLVQVAENPSINRVAIEGNDLLSDDGLLPLLQSKPRRPYTRATAEADAQVITESYRRAGRYGATIEPKLIELPDNRVDLVFEVTEGEITEVLSIKFVGNEKIGDRRLRNVIGTTESGFFSALVSSDVYDPDRLELDKQLLRTHYLEQGYADFTVLSAVAELSPDRNGFFITFTVDEGEVYEFGELSANVIAEGLVQEEFDALVPNLAGNIYDSREVGSIIDAMTFQAGKQGFAFVEIRPNVVRNENERTLDITFEVDEGRRAYVERIDIEGNDRTLDRVIRRQFQLVEGDAFNTREIAKARNRIRGLGFFKSSSVRTERGATDDRVLVKVEVEEQPTGSLSFGVGFSSSDGPLAEISVSESNFLGRGQFVRARIVASGGSQVYDLTFREPAFLDRDLAASMRVFYDDEDVSTQGSFELQRIGASPSLAFPTSENGRLSLNYEIAQSDVRDVDADASQFIADEAGKQVKSSFGYNYSFDQRNDRIETTAGYLFKFGQDLAGFGGGAQFLDTTTSAKAWTSFFGEQVVASLEVEGGALFSLNNNTRITDRHALGGDSFRGFAINGIGPRDVRVNGNGDQVNDALGGNYFAVSRAEVSFPLGLPEEVGIFGGLFLDVGSIWKLDRTTASNGDVVDDSFELRAAAGATIFWSSALGPLTLNFAVPLKKENVDETEFFRLSIGTRF